MVTKSGLYINRNRHPYLVTHIRHLYLVTVL